MNRLAVALVAAVSLAASLAAASFAPARAADPIRIGVIAEAASVVGDSLPKAAQLAADEINAAGGINGQKLEIISYDNKSSAADSVRAFQRAVQQDHVSAVIASYISEVALALEPWAGRLKTPMITPRSEVSLAEVNGKIYVLGGGITGTSVPHNEEYEIATDHWRIRYPMPRALDHMGVAVVNGKIITVGGFVASVHKDGQPSVFEYDPAFDVWRALAPLHEGRGSIGVAVLNGKVYAMGGRPLFAVNLTAWPADGLDLALLAQVLQGGAHIAAEAGWL